MFTWIDSLYYRGHWRVMCVSSPLYTVIIGKVREARQMLPDPNWKAEDQRAYRARTSGGNNDDDCQGGDIPSWMFKKESNREETKSTAPVKGDSKKKKPSQRRMITMLHRISKA